MSKIEMRERASKAAHVKHGTELESCLEADATTKQESTPPKPKERTRTKLAKKNRVSERKMRQARKVKSAPSISGWIYCEPSK
jgi:hypothetical protein